MTTTPVVVSARHCGAAAAAMGNRYDPTVAERAFDNDFERRTGSHAGYLNRG